MRNRPEKQAGVILPIENKNIEARLVRAVMFSILIILSLVTLFPILWIFLSSFKDIREFYSIPPTVIPRTFHPEKIIGMWKDMKFARIYTNTISIILGELVMGLFFNGLAGYVLSRLKPKGYKLVFTLIIWTMMLPNSVSMVPLFMTFIDFPGLHLNFTNTFFPFWLLAGANTYFILIFKSFFDSISLTYIEAARIDGCNDLKIFSSIIMPLSKPVLIVVALFIVNNAWGDFLFPYLLLRDPEKYTVAVQLFVFKASGERPMDQYFVALIFSIIPPALIFAFFQKYIMTGFSLGGIKE